MKINKVITDRAKEVEGVWFDFVDEDGNPYRLKVARANNPKFRQVLSNLTQPYKRAMRLGTFPEEKRDELTLLAMARTVFVGFEGLEDDAGAPLKDTVETRLWILENSDLIRDQVSNTALEYQLFMQDEQEDAAEKPLPTSDGISNGDPH